MKPNDIELMKEWFLAYADSFIEKYPHAARELGLKKEHSLRVMNEMNAVSADLDCSAASAYAGRIAALLHDVGRFEQYAQYGTFADAHSVDHALLGLKVIHDNSLFESYNLNYADIISFAIENHNKLALPGHPDKEFLFVAKMLRDADKIDILRVVIGYYQNNDSEGVSAMLGLDDNDNMSDIVCRDILAGKTPRMEDCAGANDLKLLQMSWVYDINFPVSLQIIRERGYIDILKRHLPDVPMVREIYRQVNIRVDRLVS